MDKIIKFKTKAEQIAANADEIFYFCFDEPDRTIRLGFFRDIETKEVGLGVIRDYKEDDNEEGVTYDEVTIFCTDHDDSIYYSLMELLNGQDDDA